MHAHEIDSNGRAAIVAALEDARHQMASGQSHDGYVKQLTTSRWMFYVSKNGEWLFETSDLDDAIKHYNEL